MGNCRTCPKDGVEPFLPRGGQIKRRALPNKQVQLTIALRLEAFPVSYFV